MQSHKYNRQSVPLSGDINSAVFYWPILYFLSVPLILFLSYCSTKGVIFKSHSFKEPANLRPRLFVC